MSMIPGILLEDFLSDAYRVFDIGGQYGNDWARSWNKATDGEIYGGYTFLEDKDFKKFVSYFEPIRERIEYLLLEFDEDNMSYRDYKYFTLADELPDEIEDKALEFLKQHTKKEL